MDTYHTYFIVKYHRKTLKLRKARGLPPLEDENDLPNDAALNRDLELAGRGEDAVLTDEEQALLLKHQEALHKSHSKSLVLRTRMIFAYYSWLTRAISLLPTARDSDASRLPDEGAHRCYRAV